jgi:hypothetical protein
VTTEGGGLATFEVVLDTEPTASVTVALASSRPSEGRLSRSSLVFDASNWAEPQAVTVTGVDDHVSDGAQRYTIVTAPAVSDDPAYAGVDPIDLPLTNLDDEPSLRVEGADDVVTSEDGTTATFTIRLATAPTADVSVPLSSSNTGEGKVSPASLTFTPATWNVPQTVTVTGVDDDAADGTQAYAIDLGPLVSAGDTSYGGLMLASVPAFNRDNDLEAVTSSLISGNLVCFTAGTPNQFPLAVDELGGLSFVGLCDGRLQLLASADAGKTFSAPSPIPGTDDVLSYAIAAARGGTLYVAFTVPDHGLTLARTTDGGATWHLRLLMADEPRVVRVVAARDTVVIVGDPSASSTGGSPVFDSLDGGLSFHAQPTLNRGLTALAIDPDGETVWLVDDDLSLLSSGDAGATFQPVGVTRGVFGNCCYALGPHDLYSVSTSGISATSLGDGTTHAIAPGPVPLPFAAAVDDADDLMWFTSDPATHNLLGTHTRADFPMTTSKLVGPGPRDAGAIPLARVATAVGELVGQQVWFGVTRWP